MRVILPTLIFVALFSACQRTVIYDGNYRGLKVEAEKIKSYDIPLKRGERATVQRFFEAYEAIGVDCKQPCVVEINEQKFHSKLDNGTFWVKFITAPFPYENYQDYPVIQVDDHENIFITLDSDANSESVAGIIVFSLSEQEKQELIALHVRNQNDYRFFWLIGGIAFIGIIGLSLFIFRLHIKILFEMIGERFEDLVDKVLLPSKPTPKRPVTKKVVDNKITPEDILKHVDD